MDQKTARDPQVLTERLTHRSGGAYDGCFTWCFTWLHLVPRRMVSGAQWPPFSSPLPRRRPAPGGGSGRQRATPLPQSTAYVVLTPLKHLNACHDRHCDAAPWCRM